MMNIDECKIIIYEFIKNKECFSWIYINSKREKKEVYISEIIKIWFNKIWCSCKWIYTYKDYALWSFLSLSKMDWMLNIKENIDINKWIDDFFMWNYDHDRWNKKWNIKKEYSEIIRNIPHRNWWKLWIIINIYDWDWWRFYNKENNRIESFRIYWIDAPEIDSEIDYEKNFGDKAKNELDMLISEFENAIIYFRDMISDLFDIYWRRIIEIEWFNWRNLWLHLLKIWYAIPIFAWDYSNDIKNIYLENISDAFENNRWLRNEPEIRKLYPQILIDKYKKATDSIINKKSSFISKFYTSRKWLKNDNIIQTILIWLKYHDLNEIMPFLKDWAIIDLVIETSRDEYWIAWYYDNKLIWYIPNPDSENSKQYKDDDNISKDKKMFLFDLIKNWSYECNFYKMIFNKQWDPKKIW